MSTISLAQQSVEPSPGPDVIVDPGELFGGLGFDYGDGFEERARGNPCEHVDPENPTGLCPCPPLPPWVPCP